MFLKLRRARLPGPVKVKYIQFKRPKAPVNIESGNKATVGVGYEATDVMSGNIVRIWTELV